VGNLHPALIKKGVMRIQRGKENLIAKVKVQQGTALIPTRAASGIKKMAIIRQTILNLLLLLALFIALMVEIA
jgi:hypothetical protein